MSGAIKQFYGSSNSGGGSNPVLDIIQIGTLGNASTNLLPVRQYYEHGWSTMIIDQADIAKQGEIQAIEFAIKSPNNKTNLVYQQRIFMGHTTLSTFPAFSVQEDLVQYYGVTNFTQVFGALGGSNITYTSGATPPTWKQIDFGQQSASSTFQYNNTDNLIIQYFNNQYPNYISSSDEHFFYYNNKVDANGYVYWYLTQPSSGNRTSLQPVIKLHVFG